jgi:large subunit ribosomal protein L19
MWATPCASPSCCGRQQSPQPGFRRYLIAKKHGGINESITVRRISYNVGCEKVFPVHSPSIVSVETLRKGKVRRAKLYFLRDRVGKRAKVKERL